MKAFLLTAAAPIATPVVEGRQAASIAAPPRTRPSMITIASQ